MATLNSLTPSPLYSTVDTLDQAQSLKETQKWTDKKVTGLIINLHEKIEKYRHQLEITQTRKDWPPLLKEWVTPSPKEMFRIRTKITGISKQILSLLVHVSTKVFKQVEVVFLDWNDRKLLDELSKTKTSSVITRLQTHVLNYIPENKTEINELYQQLLSLAHAADNREFEEIKKLSDRTIKVYKDKIARIGELRSLQRSKIVGFLLALQETYDQAKTDAALPWETYTLGTAASNQLQEKLILKQIFFRLVNLAHEAIPSSVWNNILMHLEKEEMLQENPSSALSQRLSSNWSLDNVNAAYQLILEHKSEIFGVSDEKIFTLKAINPIFNRLLKQMGKNFLEFNTEEKEFIMEVVLEAEKQANLKHYLKKQLNNGEEVLALKNEIDSLISQAKEVLKCLSHDIPTDNLDPLESAFNILDDMNRPIVTTNPTWLELMQRSNFALNVIGEGSFGRVYLAERNKERYIIKEFLHDPAQKIAPPTLEEWLSADRGERTARLKHPHLIMTIGAFVGQTHIQAIVMPYVESSVTLFDVIKKQQLRSEKIPPLFKQLLQAVKTLHEADIMHKDIKVDNILVVRNEKDEHEKLYLIDAGLQEKLTKIKPKSTYSGGSPDYAAPEVWKKPHDRSADIYSLGVTLLVMYRGRVHKDPKITLNQITNGSLKKLISDMLKLDPEKRPHIDLVIQRYETLFPTNT